MGIRRVSDLRDLRLRCRDALGIRMRARAACARTHGSRAILRDLAAAIRDGLSGGRVLFFAAGPTWKMAPRTRGRSALSRAYQCRDGAWMFVHAAAPAEWDAMRRVCKLAAVAPYAVAAREPEDGALARAIAAAFASVDRAQALAALARPEYLRSARIARLNSRRSPGQANDLLAELRHSHGEPSCRPAHWRNSPRCLAGSSAPRRFWASNRRVLARYLGYGRERIEDFRRRGMVEIIPGGPVQRSPLRRKLR